MPLWDFRSHRHGPPFLPWWFNMTRTAYKRRQSEARQRVRTPPVDECSEVHRGPVSAPVPRDKEIFSQLRPRSGRRTDAKCAVASPKPDRLCRHQYETLSSCPVTSTGERSPALPKPVQSPLKPKKPTIYARAWVRPGVASQWQVQRSKTSQINHKHVHYETAPTSKSAPRRPVAHRASLAHSPHHHSIINDVKPSNLTDFSDWPLPPHILPYHTKPPPTPEQYLKQQPRQHQHDHSQPQHPACTAHHYNASPSFKHALAHDLQQHNIHPDWPFGHKQWYEKPGHRGHIHNFHQRHETRHPQAPNSSHTHPHCMHQHRLHLPGPHDNFPVHLHSNLSPTPSITPHQHHNDHTRHHPATHSYERTRSRSRTRADPIHTGRVCTEHDRKHRAFRHGGHQIRSKQCYASPPPRCRDWYRGHEFTGMDSGPHEFTPPWVACH